MTSLDKVVLVVKDGWLEEAVALTRCLGPKVLRVVKLSKSFRPNTKYYLTKPVLERVKELVGNDRINKLIIYDNLKPRHVFLLMRELKIDVIDKITLILEIFALHAGSKEAKLQIEMARIMHQLPLIREWIRKVKMREFPGFLGSGAYAIDTYYNHMRRRLAKIRRELRELRLRRARERARRSRLGYPQVAIAGYTNAGKTTLFNALTGESKPVGPEMFTTLSPKAKGVYLGDGVKVILVDTVGFIRDIPAEVIEAFYATLEEISEADLTVLVIDSSDPLYLIKDKVIASLRILSKVGYVGKPLVIALNKIDLVSSSELSNVRYIVEDVVRREYPWSWYLVEISASKRLNLGKLAEVMRYAIREHRREKISLRTEIRASTRA